MGSECSVYLHILNSILKDMIKLDLFKKVLKAASTIATSFRHSSHWMAMIKQWANENNKPAAIESYTPTRWFSFYDLCNSIGDKKIWFQETFSLETEEGRSNRKRLSSDVVEVLFKKPIYDDLNEVTCIVKKIIIATKTLEKENSSISEIWPTIINLYREYTDLSEDQANPYSNQLKDVLAIIDTRSKFLHEDLFLVAFFWFIVFIIVN